MRANGPAICRVVITHHRNLVLLQSLFFHGLWGFFVPHSAPVGSDRTYLVPDRHRLQTAGPLALAIVAFIATQAVGLG